MAQAVQQTQQCEKPSWWKTHKFTILRNIVYISVILALIIIPTFKIIKIDLAHNVAWIFGEERKVIDGLIPVIAALGVFAILVIVLNMIQGRVFCGWICPGGWFAEVQEKIKRKLARHHKAAYIAITFVMTIIFAAIFFNWVTDLRVFFYYTNPAFFPMWIAFLAAFPILFWELYIGKRWCRTFCPTGIYQKLTPHFYYYKPALKPPYTTADCGTCRECLKVCPMALDPRKIALMEDTINRPGLSSCIVCGECVDACTEVWAKKCKEPILGFLHEVPVRQV